MLLCLLQSCYSDDGYYYWRSKQVDYVHTLKPIDSQQKITFIAYPEANKKFINDTATAVQLLVSAYENSFVVIGTNTDTFELLLNPQLGNTSDPKYILYQGYKILQNDFNSYYKTSTVEGGKDQWNNYTFLLDTLYFK